MEQDFGVVYFLFLDLGDKSTVEVRLWTLVEQILVTAVLFKDEKDGMKVGSQVTGALQRSGGARMACTSGIRWPRVKTWMVMDGWTS